MKPAHGAARSLSITCGPPTFYRPYRAKVYKLWQVVRRRAAEVHRAEVMAAYLERRARREAKAAERGRDRN